MAPEMISSYLNNQVMNLLDFTPLLMTVGSFSIHMVASDLEYSNINTQIQFVHIVLLIISVINIFLPHWAITKRMSNYIEKEKVHQRYSDQKKHF